MSPAAIERECADIVRGGGTRDDVVAHVRARGGGIIDTIKIVRALFKVSLGDAKRIVEAHPVWRGASSALHRELDYVALFSQPTPEVVDTFISERLAAAKVWQTARTSDGVSALHELLRSDDLVRVRGVIWQIDQRRCAFVLDLPADGEWTLYFDGPEHTSTPEREQWRVILSASRAAPAAT